MTAHRTFATLACTASLIAGAAAQEGAYDADPYFSDRTVDPYAGAASPPRASQGQTERAAPTAAAAASVPTEPRALPRPRAAAPVLAQSAYAAPGASVPHASSASGAQARPAPMPSQAGSGRQPDRPLTAYVEARTGWDAPRGANRDDGVLAGLTAGFDHTIRRAAGGRLYAGLLASVDISSAGRANASEARDETGANPVITLTESPTSETRDVEVGGRLGWRTDRFGFYAMAALSNRKRETETVTTTFTELVAPTEDADGAAQPGEFTRDSVETTGVRGLFADGWRVGAGVEARVYGPAYLHVGYRYADYDEAGTRHQVLTGLGARF